MPNYDYVCAGCGVQYEISHPIGQSLSQRCAECDTPLTKMVTSFGIGSSSSDDSSSVRRFFTAPSLVSHDGNVLIRLSRGSEVLVSEKKLKKLKEEGKFWANSKGAKAYLDKTEQS